LNHSASSFHVYCFFVVLFPFWGLISKLSTSLATTPVHFFAYDLLLWYFWGGGGGGTGLFLYILICSSTLYILHIIFEMCSNCFLPRCAVGEAMQGCSYAHRHCYVLVVWSWASFLTLFTSVSPFASQGVYWYVVSSPRLVLKIK
jgi:hypothetical protein